MEVNLEKLKNEMLAQTQKNNVMANNLANINTAGYKRDIVFHEVLEDSTKSKMNVETDFSQGQLKQTDNPLDLAISGKGLFTIETDQGEVYTRDGHFTVGQEGFLQTSDGNPVLGRGGVISVTTDGLKEGEISVTALGEVFVDGQLIDELKIIDFETYTDLQKIGDNLFKAKDGILPIIVDEPTVIQGSLEGSNVSPVQEMINLIEIQRQFESVQRAVRTIDNALGRAVNDISRFR